MKKMETVDNIYEELYQPVLIHPIDPGTEFGKNVRIGYGVIIDKGCVIGDNVFIGHNSVLREGVHIGNNSVIGHLVMIELGTKIGERVTIQSNSHITGYATIEDRVFMGPMSMCINTWKISHGRNFKAEIRGPTIKYGARIGSGSVIMPGIVIGRECLIGVNSTVTKHCDDFGKYIGNPATFRGVIPSEERLAVPVTQQQQIS